VVPTKQFENPANAEIHKKSTAQEILSDFSEIGLDYFVSGYGSGGTLAGEAKGQCMLQGKSLRN
jgi:cysteine synthase A